MQILHVVSDLRRYGPAASLLRLVSGDAEPRRHRVAVLRAEGPLGESFENLGIEVSSVDCRWGVDPFAWQRLAQLVSTTGAKIVHAWDRRGAAYVATVRKKLTDVRVICTLGDPEGPEGLPARKLLIWALSRCDQVVASSQTTQTMLSRLLAQKQPCRLIPLGASVPLPVDESKGDFCERNNLPDDARLVATAGHFEASQGMKELIWAADMVRVLWPSLRFLIYGSGSQQSLLEQFARTAAVPENICFMGDRSPSEAMPWIDVYWEGNVRGDQSGTMLQAMAAGVPVVACDTPLAREWIVPGETGTLVGYDARADRSRMTDQWLGDPDTAKQIGSAAQQSVAEHHALAAMVDAYRGLYEM